MQYFQVICMSLGSCRFVKTELSIHGDFKYGPSFGAHEKIAADEALNWGIFIFRHSHLDDLGCASHKAQGRKGFMSMISSPSSQLAVEQLLGGIHLQVAILEIPGVSQHDNGIKIVKIRGTGPRKMTNKKTNTHTHTYMYTYIYIYIYHIPSVCMIY